MLTCRRRFPFPQTLNYDELATFVLYHNCTRITEFIQKKNRGCKCPKGQDNTIVSTYDIRGDFNWKISNWQLLTRIGSRENHLNVYSRMSCTNYILYISANVTAEYSWCRQFKKFFLYIKGLQLILESICKWLLDVH